LGAGRRKDGAGWKNARKGTRNMPGFKMIAVIAILAVAIGKRLPVVGNYLSFHLVPAPPR
jgi:hypothetical protein